MEVNLFAGVERPVDRSGRLERRRGLSAGERAELCRFEGEYFDGQTGYGGYHYDGRHEAAVREMVRFYGLGAESRVLDVGCAKGFMLYEFFRLGITKVCGCDVSEYALQQAKPEIRDRLDRLSADRLSYADGSFDLVYSVDVIHNLEPEGCDEAIREIMRVSRRHTFIQVASFEGAEQERRLREWGVTVKTFRDKGRWRAVFETVGYRGDYFLKTY